MSFTEVLHAFNAWVQTRSQQPLSASDLTNSDESHGDKKLLRRPAMMISLSLSLTR